MQIYFNLNFNSQQIKELANELKELRFFNLFENTCASEVNEEANNKNNEQTPEILNQVQERVWQCYFCANPERINDLIYEKPLIQGQLKEKHGKWKFLRRWRKRLYTLTGGNIVYFKKDMVNFSNYLYQILLVINVLIF